MQARMRGLMAQEGLPYGERTHTFNSRLAQELGAWAVTQADGEGIHEALFQAYFVAGKNIGDIDILVELDPGTPISLFDHAGLKLYIADLFPKPVDLVNRDALKP